MDHTSSNIIEDIRTPGSHLSLEERGMIQALHRQGLSLRGIAAALGCAHTTVLWMRKNKRMKGRCIEERPAVVHEGTEIGHWEVNTVVGQRASHQPVIFTTVKRSRVIISPYAFQCGPVPALNPPWPSRRSCMEQSASVRFFRR